MAEGALEAAQEELAITMMPHPDEFMEAYSPQAALLFLKQVSESCLRVVTGAAAAMAGDADGDQPVLNEVLNGVAQCIVGSIHALVALEVLPVEAEEAMTR